MGNCWTGLCSKEEESNDINSSERTHLLKSPVINNYHQDSRSQPYPVTSSSISGSTHRGSAHSTRSSRTSRVVEANYLAKVEARTQEAMIDVYGFMPPSKRLDRAFDFSAIASKLPSVQSVQLVDSLPEVSDAAPVQILLAKAPLSASELSNFKQTAAALSRSASKVAIESKDSLTAKLLDD
ncbi:hypothetical protein CAOG_07300 [Capsaspora owczarzaki ATCC 30864]|uniref:Ragulator complex protein LAMTOR1 n=1 Tax=Capsaspora owczarzaki (strain ATCC 30864) TaxID=595528 RepID=A0A0D2VZX4_CAPO3|nr:hypothetical protein CAOG_07300 [Capsaspora owczarzaki ATCC 30864]KJE97442.1 hypothetical protein CAOG_007300 [Capsaspora owczarzaki ATCC 30864]|eukprot:XP_004343159.1 hypothetical protein CAOG_07300 [Capsaspora owczarzaki ATCC 30864]